MIAAVRDFVDSVPLNEGQRVTIVDLACGKGAKATSTISQAHEH